MCGKSTPETFRDCRVKWCSATVEIVTVGRQSSVKNEDKSPAQAELGRGTLKCSDGPPDRALVFNETDLNLVALDDAAKI